jgi:hypothetical protein
LTFSCIASSPQVELPWACPDSVADDVHNHVVVHARKHHHAMTAVKVRDELLPRAWHRRHAYGLLPRASWHHAMVNFHQLLGLDY